jgi:hypothetical protein
VRSAHESRSATVRAAAAAPSKRQQSKWQREQSQLHSLYIGVGALVVVVLAIFVGGLVYENIILANETVAQIGPDNVTAGQLLDEMRGPARRIDAQAKAGGGGSQAASAVDQQKRSLPDQTLNDLIDRHIVQQEADRRGISMSPTELDDKERETVAQVNLALNPAPTAVPTATPEGGAPTSVPTPFPTPDRSITPTAIPTLELAACAARSWTATSCSLEPHRPTTRKFRIESRRGGEEQVAPPRTSPRTAHPGADRGRGERCPHPLQGGADFAQPPAPCRPIPIKGQGGDSAGSRRAS